MSKSPLMPSYRRVLELLEQRNETRAEFDSALGIGNPYLLALAAPPLCGGLARIGLRHRRRRRFASCARPPR